MSLTYLASPLSPRVPKDDPRYGQLMARNRTYARLCVLHATTLGEAVYASHVMLCDVLDDANETHRKLGIGAGTKAIESCFGFAAYLDLGWSPGMQSEAEHWLREREELRQYDERRLFGDGFSELTPGQQVALMLEKIERLQAEVK